MSEERPTVTWYAVNMETDSADRISKAGTKLLNDAGIDVNFEIKWLGWDNYDQTISNMITSGEEFDLFNKDISTIDSYALNNGIYEITDDDLKQYLPDVVDAMGDSIVNGCRYNGHLYAVPVAHEFAQWLGVYYNEGIAQKYGIDMSTVKSIDDLDQIFFTLHAAAPDIYCLDPYNSENILMVMADIDPINRNDKLGLAMDLSDSDGNVFNQWESDKVRSALIKLKEWNDAGYLFTDTTADGVSMFQKDGQIFCHIARMKPGTVEQYSTAGQTFKNVLFTEKGIQTFCDFPGGWGVAVSGTSDNPTAAMQVVNFAYSSADFINLLTFGEEGVDYDLSSDNIVSIHDTGYGADEYSGASWQMGNQYLNYITDAQVAAGESDIWNRLKEFNDTAIPQKHTGFYFDTSNYSAEITAVTNTNVEYGHALITGEVDDVDAALKEFNENLKANGMDTLVGAANEQYKEFLAAKGNK